MNARQYQWRFTLTAVPLFLLMGWCGLSLAVALPVLPGWVIGTHRADTLTAMALLAAAGLITAYWQVGRPCPLAQMRMACLLGTGLVLMKLWVEEGTLFPLLEMPGTFLVRMAEVAALFFPTVTVISFLFTLMPRHRRSLRPAALNLLMLLLMIVAAEAVRTLLKRPNLEWSHMLDQIPELRGSAYMLALRGVMGVYMKIPAGIRACAGLAGLAAVVPALYREGTGRPARARPRTRQRSASGPQFRPAGAATRMNARDLELLDALAAQTVAGDPVGLNTETGTVGLRRRR